MTISSCVQTGEVTLPPTGGVQGDCAGDRRITFLSSATGTSDNKTVTEVNKTSWAMKTADINTPTNNNLYTHHVSYCKAKGEAASLLSAVIISTLRP